VNLPDEDSWTLYLSWLVAALRPGRPYPVLAVNGEQGSAKTTLCRMGRGLMDPNRVPLRRPPRDERDLMIAASNSWVVAINNLSWLRQDLSDALCSLATEGGFGARQLYTDDSEMLFDAVRPIILNGIPDVVDSPDLGDRSVRLTLPPIDDKDRCDEETLWQRYYEKRPRVLGALLDAVSAGLRTLPGVKLDSMPRMADFARWAVACEQALGLPEGAFLRAYSSNRIVGDVVALEASPIVAPLRQVLKMVRGQWTGTASRLLELLTGKVSEKTAKSREWPQRADKLSAKLKRLTPNLRRVGIGVEFAHTGRFRTITLTRTDSQSSVSSVSSVGGVAPPENAGNPHDAANATEDTPNATAARSVSGKTRKTRSPNAANATNATSHHRSNGEVDE
jgi:hypothetical protein